MTDFGAIDSCTDPSPLADARRYGPLPTGILRALRPELARA